MGAKEIVLYGVDLINHHNLSVDIKQKRVITDITALYMYLLRRKVNLMVYNKSSLLSQILPYLSNE
jgi:hypothetical protein